MIITLPKDNGNFLEIYDSNTQTVYYGGRQQLFTDKRYRDKGCGSIAIANIILYMHIGKKRVSLGEYTDIAEKVNQTLKPDADGFALMRAYRTYTGCKVKYFPLIFNKKEMLFERIKLSLSDDRPLVISVYNKKSYPVYRTESITENIRCSREYRVKAHYMTVTGVAAGNNKRWIIMSNWGERFVLDYDDYYDVNKYLFRNGAGSSIGSGIFEFTK